MADSPPSEGKRAVHRAVKSYLAANGITRAEIRKMIDASVNECLLQVLRESLSNENYLVAIMMHKRNYQFQTSIYEAVKTATMKFIETNLELKVKGKS
jgi:hypothetical protein